MPIVDIDTLRIGQVISFQSKEIRDTVTRVGKIKAISDYRVIDKVILDVVPRYSAIRKQFPSMPPLDELEFLVLELEQDGAQANYAIAKEWIEPTSIQIVERMRHFAVNLYDVDEAQIEEALHVLRSNGFKCSKA